MLDLSKSLKENDVSDIVERLRSWDHGIPKTMIVSEAAAEIERLRAEVADLTGANVLLHGIVSNREEEISGLRTQLASAQEKLTMVDGTIALERSGLGIDTHATMVELCRKFAARQIELEARLASARKALEIVLSYIDGEMIERAVVNTSSMRTLGEVVRHALTDEKST